MAHNEWDHTCVAICVCVRVPSATGSRRVVTAAAVIILIFYKNIFYY